MARNGRRKNLASHVAVLILVALTGTHAQATVLGNAAAALAPGAWAEVPTNKINEVLSNTGGSSNTIFGYAEKIAWDPVSRRLFYFGHDHRIVPPRLVTYHEDTNSWERLADILQSFLPEGADRFNYGYGVQTVDPNGRYFYVRHALNSPSLARHDIDRDKWDSVLPPAPPNGFPGCCHGTEYFDEMHGIV